MSAPLQFEGRDAMTKSLDALEPASKRNNAAKFASLYDNIEQALGRGVTQRAILEALERDGFKLHPAKFKKLLDEARALRSKSAQGLGSPSYGWPKQSAKENQRVEGGEK